MQEDERARPSQWRRETFSRGCYCISGQHHWQDGTNKGGTPEVGQPMEDPVRTSLSLKLS